ncbi:MAG TPA: hypothetical protein ENK53_02930, partial [Thiotrichales bacterium]|nr:hypothetical protein [Thiotrichales bacterium]
MQIDSALALQTLTTSARDQTAAPARPGANPATNTEPDPANTHDTGSASDKVSVSEPGHMLSAGAAGSIVRQRSTSVVIETRDGDRIRLDIQAQARLDAAAVAATDGERQLAGAAMRRSSEFSLRFSVEGTLDRR